MKKIIYSLGAILLFAAPSFVVSCANNLKQETGIQESTKFTKISFDNFIKENKMIKSNEKIIVSKDEVVLFHQYYSGKINDKFDNKNDGAAILRTSEGMNFSGSNGIMEMGEKDSLIFLYNNDDSDGLSLNNFRETIKFVDTSVISALAPLLKIIGVKESTFGEMDIPFIGNEEEGSLLSYFGSQNNHSPETWNQAMAECKKIYKPNIYNKIKEYYKKASHAFKPIPIPQNTITYKKIGVNAIKLSFSDKAPVTAAGIVIKPINKKAKMISPLSIGGPNEWKAYDKNPYKKNLLGYHNLKYIKEMAI